MSEELPIPATAPTPTPVYLSSHVAGNGETPGGPNVPIGPVQRYPNFHIWMVPVFAFIWVYSLLGLWLLFDGWINGFEKLHVLWGLHHQNDIPAHYRLALMSMVGAILGCGTLDIISFHKYVAIKKSFDVDHVWGFFMAPLLAAIVGVVVFALFQSGFWVFSGGFESGKSEDKMCSFSGIWTKAVSGNERL